MFIFAVSGILYNMRVSKAEQNIGKRLETTRRIDREKRTVRAMAKIYCRGHHSSGHRLCAECQALLDYAEIRLDRCPFQENKTTCANCQVHCYQPAMRERIKEVMRYSGPRMTFRHPVLALFHIKDGRKKAAGRNPTKP